MYKSTTNYYHIQLEGFEDYHIKILLPIRVYADFDSINQPKRNDCKGDPKVLYEQIPIAVGFYLISPFGNQYYSCCGEGQQSCVTWFVNEMLFLEKIAGNCFKTNLELEITPQEEESFQQSTICWLCEQLVRECSQS